MHIVAVTFGRTLSAMWPRWLAIALSVCAAMSQSLLSHPAIAMVIDSDSPVADAASAAALRRRALGKMEQHPDALFVNLTSAALEQVPHTTRPAPASHDVSTTFEQAGPVLRSSGAYVVRFEQTFSSVIWHERYTQVSRQRRQFASSGSTFSAVTARRSLDSELFLAWVPEDASWIAVRDVISVDGAPRPPQDRRLQGVLNGTTVSSGQLRQLATGNGRFNIGQIVHTFNEPTLALLFLDEHYRQRFAFTPAGEEIIDGRRALAHKFTERGRPTVIQEGNRDVPASGTIWIEAATGRVLQTSLVLSGADGRLSGRMTVQYGPHPKFDVFVPVEMREVYTSSAGEEIATTATYSDFRRFETGARLIHRP